MSKFDSKKAMPRFSFIAILMTLIAVAVLGKTMYIMTAKHDFWMQVADRVKVDTTGTRQHSKLRRTINGIVVATI